MSELGNKIKSGIQSSKAFQFAKANPYLAAAAVVIGGFSFFSARKAEKERRRRLRREMNADIQQVQDSIPGIQQEYARTADLYASAGNVQGQMIYQRAASQMQLGGQTNLAFGGADVKRNELGGLLGQQLAMQNINTQNRLYNTQNALASELNRQQMNVDQIRAAYAEQGVSSPDISIGDVNTLKYV